MILRDPVMCSNEDCENGFCSKCANEIVELGESCPKCEINLKNGEKELSKFKSRKIDKYF